MIGKQEDERALMEIFGKTLLLMTKARNHLPDSGEALRLYSNIMDSLLEFARYMKDRDYKFN